MWHGDIARIIFFGFLTVTEIGYAQKPEEKPVQNVPPGLADAEPELLRQIRNLTSSLPEFPRDKFPLPPGGKVVVASGRAGKAAAPALMPGVTCSWPPGYSIFHMIATVIVKYSSVPSEEYCAYLCGQSSAGCKAVNFDTLQFACELLGNSVRFPPYTYDFIYTNRYIEGIQCTGSAAATCPPNTVTTGLNCVWGQCPTGAICSGNMCCGISVAPTQPLPPNPSGGDTQCGVQAPGYAPQLNPSSMRAVQNKIVGGQTAIPGSWPWQVSLMQTQNGGLFCGGTLLKQNIILTAAHCVEDLVSASNLWVRAGDHSRTKVKKKLFIEVPDSNGRSILVHNEQVEAGEETIQVARFKIHEQYNPKTTENDVAILKLVRGVTLGPTKRVICLPQPNQSPPAGTQAGAHWRRAALLTFAAGYEGKMPDALQEALVPIVSDSVCNDASHYAGMLKTSVMFCAGRMSGGVDSCQGDSGGPLVCKQGNSWVIHGITSWGNGCADANYPGVYARVSTFTNWILATANSI